MKRIWNALVYAKDEVKAQRAERREALGIKKKTAWEIIRPYASVTPLILALYLFTDFGS